MNPETFLKLETEEDAEQFARNVLGIEVKDLDRMDVVCNAAEVLSHAICSMPQTDADMLEAAARTMREHTELVSTYGADATEEGMSLEQSSENLHKRAAMHDIILEAREKLIKVLK